MSSTSSRSAKDTLKTDDELVISGTLPTDPLSVDTFSAMARSRRASIVKWSDRRYATWNIWGRVKHLFGIHTFVPLEEWDTERGTIRITGSICWHCSARLGDPPRVKFDG